jgi:hypothetical protein
MTIKPWGAMGPGEEVFKRVQADIDRAHFRMLRIELVDPFGQKIAAIEYMDTVPGLATFLWATDPDAPQINVPIPVGDERAPYQVRITAT